MIEKCWKAFFGTGWLHGQEPSKQDCFKAGFEAGLKEGFDAKYTVLKNITKKEMAELYPKNKTVREKITEWQEKFNE